MAKDKKNDTIKEIIKSGSEISGGIGGAIIGSLITGPLGTILGGASGPIIAKIFEKTGIEVKKRLLGRREEIRIGAAYAFAINKINENQKIGIGLRTDNFFEESEGGRPASEEILEGIILYSQREFEELKVKYLGNLYANICSDENVSKEHSHQLIKTINALSFRQLCILELLRKKFLEDKMQESTTRKIEIEAISLMDVVIEVRDLQQRGLVSIPNTFDGGNNSSPIQLHNVVITTSGQFFCKMLSLEEIETEKLDKVREVMIKT